MRWLHITLVALALVPTVAAADWTERQDTVWQDGDTIHARGRGKTEADAEKRARSALATALGSSLPDLDPELAARSAVIGDRITHGEWLHVRLDFHAANGKACRTARAWRDLGMKARDEGAETRAVAALAHAAWNDPHDLYALDALGL